MTCYFLMTIYTLQKQDAAELASHQKLLLLLTVCSLILHHNVK